MFGIYGCDVRILALDQSIKHCAYYTPEEQGFFLPPASKNDFERIHSVLSQFAGYVIENEIEVVAVEGLPFGMNSPSVRPLAGLYYGMGMFCWNEGIGFYSYPPTTIKKVMTGKGNAKKPDMVAACALTPQLMEVRNRYFKPTKAKLPEGLDDLVDAYGVYLTWKEKDGHSNIGL